DVGEVRRIAFAQIGDEFGESGKLICARFVSDILDVKGGMFADAGNEGIERFFSFWIVKGSGIKQRVLDLATQAVALGDIEAGLVTPDEIPSALGHLFCDGIGQGWAAPIGDDWSADAPGGFDARGTFCSAGDYERNQKE